MGLTLPAELTEPLGWIGLIWPQADEDQLYADGQVWISYGSQLRAQAAQADQIAQRVWTEQAGDSIEAFKRWWSGPDGPGGHLADAATAAELIGAGLIVLAGITLALKIAFIVQLALLLVEVAQAIATAVVSFGASTAEIPGFVAATRLICRQLIDRVIQVVEREIAQLFERAAKLLEKLGAKGLAEDAGKLAGKLSQDSAFRRLLGDVEHADVRSPVDGARFYSGRQPDGTPMRRYAEGQTDGVTSTTLEQTPGGRHFDDLHLYDKGSPISQKQADQVWSRLSERYAQDARGQVTAYVHNPRPGAIWNRERQALEDNPNVTGISVVDPFAGS